MKPIKFLLFLFLTTFFLASCTDDDTVVEQKSVVDIVVDDPNFSLLEAAVLHAGLVDALKNPSITVFAPTDAAFKAAGFTTESDIKAVDKTALGNILQYHVIGSLVPSTAIIQKDNDQVNMLNNLASYVTKNSSGVSVNGAKVTSADIKAENGAIIHIIDAVLIPETRNIVQIAQSNPNLSFLVEAVVRANEGSTKVIDILSSAGPFTVFAPTNDAFKAAGFATEAAVRAADPVFLAGILTYHVIPARVYSTNLTTGNVGTAQAGLLAINASSATVKGNSNNNPSKIMTVNIPASNGVIHVIDSVLLP